MNKSMASKDNLEKPVLRWGGLAGILGGIVFLFVPIVLFGFVPPAPSDPSAVVARFPSVSMAITVGNNLNFISDMLDLALLVALYRALRGTNFAPALFGTVMSILGLGVIFTETQTQVAFAPLSDLYHASGSTVAQQQQLGLIWAATQAMFFELDTAAGLLLSLGFIVLAIGMIKAPGFGKTTGVISAVLAALSLIGISLIPVLGETSVVAVLAVPVFIVLPILWGWKTYRLSKAT
ncbi:MAG TPA: hypothetical protein VFE96_09430 [Candidatus Bathyarchaeia archaeon]|nr:hypothetical protein [Candidatus Bathyarchaeia archaeon]